MIAGGDNNVKVFLNINIRIANIICCKKKIIMVTKMGQGMQLIGCGEVRRDCIQNILKKL